MGNHNDSTTCQRTQSETDVNTPGNESDTVERVETTVSGDKSVNGPQSVHKSRVIFVAPLTTMWVFIITATLAGRAVAQILIRVVGSGLGVSTQSCCGPVAEIHLAVDLSEPLTGGAFNVVHS